jgi:hypothetical protein
MGGSENAGAASAVLIGCHLPAAGSAGTATAQLWSMFPVSFMVLSLMSPSKNQQLNCLIFLGWKQAGLDTITQKP